MSSEVYQARDNRQVFDDDPGFQRPVCETSKLAMEFLLFGIINFVTRGLELSTSKI
jgi:hypothetical protein